MLYRATGEESFYDTTEKLKEAIIGNKVVNVIGDMSNNRIKIELDNGISAYIEAHEATYSTSVSLMKTLDKIKDADNIITDVKLDGDTHADEGGSGVMRWHILTQSKDVCVIEAEWRNQSEYYMFGTWVDVGRFSYSDETED